MCMYEIDVCESIFFLCGCVYSIVGAQRSMEYQANSLAGKRYCVHVFYGYRMSGKLYCVHGFYSRGVLLGDASEVVLVAMCGAVARLILFEDALCNVCEAVVVDLYGACVQLTFSEDVVCDLAQTIPFDRTGQGFGSLQCRRCYHRIRESDLDGCCC